MSAEDQARPVREGEELPLPALTAFIEGEVGVFGRVAVEQFPGGHSNLTYLVHHGDREYVLRRPPFGSTVKSAHDMGREVAVMNRGKYLHFIAHVAGLYVLTTIHGCIERDARSGVCLTYGASQSRHFDPRVLSEPDAVYEALKDRSDPGFCDHSFIGLQEGMKKR